EHPDAWTSEGPEIVGLDRMARELRRQRVEERGPGRERRDARGHDDPSRRDRLAVSHDDAESVVVRLDPTHRSRIELGQRVRLEPLAVRDEVRERDRRRYSRGAFLHEGIEAMGAVRFADVRRAPVYA